MILDAVVDGRIKACASLEIVSEYQEIVEEMINESKAISTATCCYRLFKNLSLCSLFQRLLFAVIPMIINFLECAKDSGSLYIVSGDKDLLVIQTFEGIQIITAKDFLDAYLNTPQNL